MLPIKDLLPVVYRAILKEHASVITETDSNPDRWYELFVTYPDNGGTETVGSADKFEQIYESVKEYIREYRFDRLHIDIWENRDEPEEVSIAFSIPELAYKAIQGHFKNNNHTYTLIGDVKNQFSDSPIYYKGETENGLVFKDKIAFTYFHDLVCYIPEYSNDDEEAPDTYTYSDFEEICIESPNHIESLFDIVDWQHPSTLWEEWKQNGTLDEEEDEAESRQVILGYVDSGDLVSCTWCGQVMLVPTGADKCPNCYYEGALSWFDGNSKEATYSELEKDKRYSVQSKNEPEPAEYLSDETLIGEFELTPNPLFKNSKQE